METQVPPLRDAAPAEPSATSRAAGVLAWAALVALGVATVRLVGIAVTKATVRPMTGHGTLDLWTVPTAELLWTAAAAIPAAALAAWGPPKLRRTLPYALAILPSWLSAAWSIPWLHVSAAALLAVGVAWRLGGGAADGGPIFRRRVLRAAAGTGLLLGLVAATAGLAESAAERGALAALPEAGRGRPNVLLVVLDTVRARELGLYAADGALTPTLDRLGADGVVVERALATAPWTLPTHASLFTGRYPHHLGVGWKEPLPEGPATLAEVFAANGYRTLGVSANVWNAGREAGFARGFSRFEDHRPSWSRVLTSSKFGAWFLERRRVRSALAWYDVPGRVSAGEVNAAFLEWLDDGGAARRPFFAFLNYFDAHHPYLLPHGEPGAGANPDRDRRIRHFLDRRSDEHDAESLGEARAAYRECIEHLDGAVGRLFAELGARGVLGDTLVVVTSDHGEEFGEHGHLEHGQTLYRPSLEVPLLFVAPGRVPKGVRAPGPVSLVDVAATVVDLAGIPAPTGLGGTSLAPTWSDAGRTPEGLSPVLAGVTRGINVPAWDLTRAGDMTSIVDGRSRLIRRGDGAEELFDFDGDPWERTDLRDRPEHAADLDRAREALDRAAR